MRHHCSSAGSLPDCEEGAAQRIDAAYREVRVRPMQLLYGVLPALFAGLRRAAAQSDALAWLHGYGSRDLEPVGRALLRLRVVHLVRLSRGPLSERSVRSIQARPARCRNQICSKACTASASDEGLAPR